MTSSAASQSSSDATHYGQQVLVDGMQPVLRSTLSSLNVNLDYELARYRYAKRGEAPAGVTPPTFQPKRRSLDLFTAPPSQKTPTPHQGRAGVVPPPPPPNPRLQHPTTDAVDSPSAVAALRSAIVRQPEPPQASYLASSEALLQGLETPLPAHGNDPIARPDTRSWTAALTTPLGLGALMLLLVASAGFGFVLVNPSVAGNLFQYTPLARFFQPDLEAEEAVETLVEDGDTDITAEFSDPPLTSLSPDLSRREFADLDLNTLSNLPSSSTADLAGDTVLEEEDAQANTRDRSERERGQSSNLAETNSPQRVNQIPQTTTPAPQPAAPIYQPPATAPIQPAPTAAQPSPPVNQPSEVTSQPAPPEVPIASSSAPASSYYVVTDYTGDPSLDEARTVVRDAYVRNFDMGARIQMGAFNTSEGAAALAEELSSQGIDAEIYEPE